MKALCMLLCPTIALLMSGCYAQAGYDVPGPVAYAGPVYYDAYPCEWGTCYYDGGRMVYHEQGPARAYYDGVNVRYSATAYRESRPTASRAAVLRDSPSPRSRQEQRPQATQPAQRQQGAARRMQRQPVPQREEHDHK